MRLVARAKVFMNDVRKNRQAHSKMKHKTCGDIRMLDIGLGTRISMTLIQFVIVMKQ